MGSLCSKGQSSNYTGGHQVLGGDAAVSQPTRDDPRAAALRAAEARLDATKKRGTPNQGALAQKAAANASARLEPEQREEERLVWD
uniref:Uncharacterized protein n=1 Tax=Mycena chlorophos TaxID=658473 RepID=A0ABQ0KZN6_MYCCL|nr:predicted protein [Mycena chlorophos]